MAEPVVLDLSGLVALRPHVLELAARVRAGELGACLDADAALELLGCPDGILEAAADGLPRATVTDASDGLGQVVDALTGFGELLDALCEARGPTWDG